MDIIYFKIFRSSKADIKLIKLVEIFENKKIPIMPIKADTLMEKYNISEGRELGIKLKEIEQVWMNNNFYISDEDVKKVMQS